MATIQNKLNANTPFYKSFVPFTPPQSSIITNNIFDMVSVNYIQKSSPTIINQIFGAEETFSFIIRIKNITDNTRLSGQVDVDNFFIIDEKNFILDFGETKNILVKVNNTYVNAQPDNLEVQSNIKIIVKNTTNELTYIKQNVIKLDQVSFPNNIQVR
jgi:hypothetical protein